MYLSELSNVCVQIVKYICPKNMQHKFGMHLYLDASCRHFPSEWISINTVHCKNYLSKLSNIFVENANCQMYLLKMLRIFVHKIFSYIGTSLCHNFPSEWIFINSLQKLLVQIYLFKLLQIFVQSLCHNFPSEWISITLTGRFPKPPPLQYWGQDWVGLKIGARRPEIQCLRRNPIFFAEILFSDIFFATLWPFNILHQRCADQSCSITGRKATHYFLLAFIVKIPLRPVWVFK